MLMNIQRSTPKAPFHPGSWQAATFFDAHWDHEPYSGRDGAPPPSAQRNGRTVDSVPLRHRGRGRRRSAVPTLTGFRESSHVIFDAHWDHKRAGSGYLAPPEHPTKEQLP